MLGEPEKNNLHQREIKPGQSGFFYAQRRKDLGL